MNADLALLDRQVARASIALLDGDTQALEGVYREAARQSTYDALAAIDHPLAPHVAHLTIARVGGDAVETALAEKTAMQVELPRIATRGARSSFSFDDALLETIGATSVEHARAWFDVLGRMTTEASNAAYERAQIEAEARKRLRLADDRSLVDRADAFLDRTQDLAMALANEPAALLSLASVRNAGEGWPRKLALQFAIEAFGADTKSRRTLEHLASRVRKRADPIVVGASTHVRTVARWAFEWHARAPGEPFAARHDPEWTGAHGSARLISGALATVAFQKRCLGLGERSARNQMRALDAMRLFGARCDAARLLPEDSERSERLFGRTIDAKLARLLPRPKRDARGRFRAWLDLPRLVRHAESTHDEDWFRNPRFWQEAEIRFASPPETSEQREPPTADALATMFVERLA